MRHNPALKAANLALLVLFPVAWMAPLLRAGLLPFFDLDEVSILTGLQALYEKDLFLAVLTAFLALFAPMAKTLALVSIHFGYLRDDALPLLAILGKLAMADVFLVAVYIVSVRGVGVGRIETGWGLYLFTACVLGSMVITHLTQRKLA